MNIFIVSSPFQYICANEARVFFNTKDNVLVLKTKQTNIGKIQFNSIIIESDWDYIFHQPDSGRLASIPKTIKKLIKLSERLESKKNTLYFSQYQCMLTNLIRRNLNHHRQVYFDDGIQTLKEYYEYIEKKVTYSRPRFFDDIIIQLQGIKKIGSLEYNDNLEIFSIFNIPNPTCRLHINTLSALRNTMNIKEQFDSEGAIGFIGEGNVGEEKTISESEYLNKINKVCSSRKKVIYFPHRRESEELKNKIKNIKNIKYHTPEYPIELEIYKKNIKLSKIYGMASTATYTLSIVYKEIPIEIIRFKGLPNLLPKESYEYLVSYFDLKNDI